MFSVTHARDSHIARVQHRSPAAVVLKGGGRGERKDSTVTSHTVDRCTYYFSKTLVSVWTPICKHQNDHPPFPPVLPTSHRFLHDTQRNEWRRKSTPEEKSLSKFGRSPPPSSPRLSHAQRVSEDKMVDGYSVRSVGAGFVGGRKLHHDLHVLGGTPDTALSESHRHPEQQVQALADKHTHTHIRVMGQRSKPRVCVK